MLNTQADPDQNTITCLEDVYNLFAKNFRKKDEQLIGIEHEKLLFNCTGDTPERAGFPFLQKLLHKLEKTGWEWEPIAEYKHRVEFKKHGEKISLERGGQIEYAGKPCETMHQVDYYLNAHIEEIKKNLPKDYYFSSLSFDHISSLEKLPSIPKRRYDFLENYLGYWVKTMLRGTASIQVSLDYCSDEDLMKKLTVATVFQPLMASLYFSSPIIEQRNAPYESYRSFVWGNIDPSRSGGCFAIPTQPQTLESYIDQILNIPMVFVQRGSEYIPSEGERFYDFMQGKLKNAPGILPTEDDVINFIGTTYPDIRLKKTMELRSFDNLPINLLLSIPSFWVGLLYGESSLDEAYKLALPIQYEEFMDWRKNLPNFKKTRRKRDLIEKLIAISETGIKERGFLETRFLSPLKEEFASKTSIAEKIKGDLNTMTLTNFTKTWSH